MVDSIGVVSQIDVGGRGIRARAPLGLSLIADAICEIPDRGSPTQSLVTHSRSIFCIDAYLPILTLRCHSQFGAGPVLPVFLSIFFYYYYFFR